MKVLKPVLGMATSQTLDINISLYAITSDVIKQVT
jgi:hypothetical protein